MDDLLIASKLPQTIVGVLIKIFKFKSKGTRPISYNLGCEFTRDGNNDLCLAPHRCMEKMSDSCVSFFSSNPKLTYYSLLEKVDHPELDTINFLDTDGIQRHQSLISALH